MKIMITGNQGLIGSILTPRLIAKGWEIIGYDLKSGEELNDTDKLAEKMKECEAVVHLAGIPGPWGKPWEEYQYNNVDGTLSVIEACHRNNIKKLVYMSSGATYGFSRGNCVPDQFPIKEDNQRPPESELDFYDISKIRCEEHLEEASKKYNMTCIALRLETPTPYAPVIPEHLFVSITEDNLALAIDCALKVKQIGFEAFNIADAEINPSVNIDIQEWLASRYPNVPNNTIGRHSLYDISKARSKLNYNPFL